jgi:hypothetical protein
VGSLSPHHGASSSCGWRNGLQLWRLAANILNKQSRTDSKRRSSVALKRLSGPRSRQTTLFSGSAGNRNRASGSIAKGAGKTFLNRQLGMKVCTKLVMIMELG